MLLTALLLASCASSAPRIAVPDNLIAQANVAGMTQIRFWGDQAPPNLAEITKAKYLQMKSARPKLVKKGARPSLSFLAISGGGSEGAFGAGLLAGWSENGTRPEFEIVTGVSTGALIAPFAFLGKRYDPVLKEIYTKYSTKDFLTKRPIKGLVGGDALSDNKPFKRLITKYFDAALMAELAREHNRGRRLLIGTTNLDAQRPVIWNAGGIAASGHPQALELLRKIFLASASIPGAFPPVFINVTADGKTYQEMHVDGGTTTQVFLMPSQLVLGTQDRKLKLRPKRKLYIIRNGRLSPETKPVRDRTLSIASRSISTLIKSQGIGDLFRLHAFARKNKIAFKLAFIPKDMKNTSTEAFDTAYMKKLYDLGFQLGRSGYKWQTTPPGL
ncbi:patatin-like phospholipase [bacterium BMS3Bbin10]|nr:patatin-like phospholipase [bacterium BMS3Bbin10]